MENNKMEFPEGLSLFDLLNIMVMRAEQRAIEQSIAEQGNRKPLVLRLSHSDVEWLKAQHISLEGDNR